MAATMRSEGSRERTLSLMCCICLISFIRVSVFVFSRQRLFRRTRVDHLTATRSAGVCRTQHARSVRGKSGDEQNDRPHKAHQAPRIGLSPDARNPRPVPHAATNYLRSAAWRTRIDEARAATREFSSAWTNGRRENRNGCPRPHAKHQQLSDGRCKLSSSFRLPARCCAEHTEARTHAGEHDGNLIGGCLLSGTHRPITQL